MVHVNAARRFWLEGDIALAQLRLVYAPLPRIDETGAFRAFLADRALAQGASLDELYAALGKYSAAQPRVPASSGRESGRWTSGDTAASTVVEGRSVDAGTRVRTAFLDDRRRGDVEERAREKQENTFRTETFEDARAHGHPVPLLPDVPFGMPMPGGGTTAGPKRKPTAIGGGVVPPDQEPREDDRSRLCPRSTNDRGSKDDFSRLYQEYVGTLVNPGLVPRVSGLLAYSFSTPTEKNVYIDHCDYKTGKLVEDKGHYEAAHEPGFFQNIVRKDWIRQAARQLDVAHHFGRELEWWFFEKRSKMMSIPNFSISGLWRGRNQTPDIFAQRHLLMIDALSRIHPAFRLEWVWVVDKGVSYDKARLDLPRAICQSIATDDLGTPSPTHGYTFDLINTWDKATSHTVSISVTDGSTSLLVPSNGFVISTSPWPDPTLVTFDVLSQAMLIACESFDAECSFAYPQLLMEFWSAGDVVDLAWMTYLGPTLSSKVKPPSLALVEHRANGGLIMAATRETFDVDDADHLAGARAIQTALVSFNRWAKTQKFR